jgi:hypothetical protein
MKKADKLSVVSLTQWKPDYEAAAGLFEQAGAPAARVSLLPKSATSHCASCCVPVDVRLTRRGARVCACFGTLAAVAYKNAGKKTDAATAYEKLSYCKEKLGECVPDSARPCGWSRRARGSLSLSP